jgi:intein-encoded DNA endonuclease-like protein
VIGALFFQDIVKIMSWNKGFTKTTHPGVAKISATMKVRNINNFKQWRKNHPILYANFSHTGDVAEYIGVVLGDGNIEQFPRTERITIIGDAKKMGFVIRYAMLTEKLFHKKPAVARMKNSNVVRISLYQKFIARRLGIPTGNRKDFPYKLPLWIAINKNYLLRFLRGLFEAEGSLSINLPTYTYNFAFSNLNQHLLLIVRDILQKLEFHPEVRHNAIRIRKKAEVERLGNMLHFREY